MYPLLHAFLEQVHPTGTNHQYYQVSIITVSLNFNYDNEDNDYDND